MKLTPEKILRESIPPLTELFKIIGSKRAKSIEYEDRTKEIRLEKLSKILGFECKHCLKIELETFINNPKILEKIKKTKIFDWRILPNKKNFYKKRARQKTVKEALLWIKKQNITSKNYGPLHIFPYHKIAYSGIIVITKNQIVGEIISGDLWQLIYGTQNHKPTYFIYNFKKWYFSQNIPLIEKNRVMRIIQRLQANSISKRNLLKKSHIKFNQKKYIEGYFEFRIYTNNKFILNDYDREIKKVFTYTQIPKEKSIYLSGTSASPGVAIGKKRTIKDPSKDSINKNDILVCPLMTLKHLPFLRKAAGVITKNGNCLSHMSIIARELKKPYIICPEIEKSKIKNGVTIKLNANNGLIKVSL